MYLLSIPREHAVCTNQPVVQLDMSQNSRVFLCRFAECKESTKKPVNSIYIQRESKKKGDRDELLHKVVLAIVVNKFHKIIKVFYKPTHTPHVVATH